MGQSKDLLPGGSPLATFPSRSRQVYGYALILIASTILFLQIENWNPLRTAQPSDHVAPTLIEASHGAVATEHKRCSDMGVSILQDKGGNAVDAAISAALCIGVQLPFSSGIGGGGFMTVRIPPSGNGMQSKVFNIDFRETAPSLANQSMFPPHSNLSQFGGLAVAVPGEIMGLSTAHRLWGSLPWEDLFEPVVELAEASQVGPEFARRMPWFAPLLLGEEEWSSVFAPEGKLLTENDTIHRPAYAESLRTIAREGPSAFYNGSITRSLVNKIQSKGGIVTLEDFSNYTVNVTPALEGTFRGNKIYTTQAPTSGPVLLHMLNLVEMYDEEDSDSVLDAHRFVEIQKFGFAARTRICDPPFHNDTAQIDEIPTKEFAQAIWSQIDDNRTHETAYYKPVYDVPEDHGTTHISIIDENGMAVSLTTTVNWLFGSQVLDENTGIILNNEMDDFSIPNTPNLFGLLPSPYNYPAPGKRPLSSTVPTIIERSDGSVFIAVGGAGGSRIFGAVMHVLMGVLGFSPWEDNKLNIAQAIDAPRLHDQLGVYDFVDADVHIDPLVVKGLKARGHNVTVADDFNRVAGVVSGVVVREDGTITASSDSRKHGLAAGY